MLSIPMKINLFNDMLVAAPLCGWGRVAIGLLDTRHALGELLCFQAKTINQPIIVIIMLSIRILPASA